MQSLCGNPALKNDVRHKYIRQRSHPCEAHSSKGHSSRYQFIWLCRLFINVILKNLTGGQNNFPTPAWFLNLLTLQMRCASSYAWNEFSLFQKEVTQYEIFRKSWNKTVVWSQLTNWHWLTFAASGYSKPLTKRIWPTPTYQRPQTMIHRSEQRWR